MSIYATVLSFSDEWDDDTQAPIMYRGSHLNPDPSDRAGHFDVSVIPDHCSPAARLAPGMDEGEPVPYLRVSMGDGGSSSNVLLDRAQVRDLFDFLGKWQRSLEDS